MHLDGQGPLFGQVYRALRNSIVSGVLVAGARVPASRRLAEDLGVSRTTVLAALEQLAAEGYLVGRRGSGTYVQARAAAPRPSLRRRPTTRPTMSQLGHRLSEPRHLPLQGGYVHARPALRWDFRYGLPAIREFPLEAWHRCLGRRARRSSARAFDYGPPQGSIDLREALAAYLGRARGIVCMPEQIVVVTGSQQGLDLVARLVLDPGDAAIVEEPAFEGARNAFRAAGAMVHALRADAEGLDTSQLARIPAARLVCVTPSHQFPLGGILSWSRRAELLAWAHAADAWVIEDDYDGEFRYGGRPIAPLKALDQDDRVLYLGTFSKVMFPALRLGYLVLPPAWVEPVTRMKLLADGGSARLEQDALADFISSGHFERHVRRARLRGAERRAALVEALHGRFDDRVEVVGAEAGLHVVAWMRDRPGRTTRSVVERAAAAGVGVYAITPYYTTPPPTVGLILGYAGLTPKAIGAGITRLSEAIA